MKFKLPAFLENIESPVEGEVALRKFAANPLAFGGEPDLFSAGNVAGSDASCADVANNSAAIVIGIDEVGRGPLAGPVVACAAVLKTPDALLTLNDSKKLSRPKREAMFEQVKDACACYAIASASVEEIDEMNILEADFLAMRRALQALGFPGLNETAPEIPIEVKGSFNCHPGLVPGSPFPSNILIAVDGNLKIRGVPAEKQMPIVKGDGRIGVDVHPDEDTEKLARTLVQKICSALVCAALILASAVGTSGQQVWIGLSWYQIVCMVSALILAFTLFLPKIR